jgi:hypothetical protein
MKRGAVLIGLLLAACAPPATTTRETGPRTEAPGPRFAAGRPNADEYGAGGGP